MFISRWIITGLVFVFVSLPTFAQLQRVSNTTLQMPATLPVAGFTTDSPFGTNVFTMPTCIVSPPGETNRLFILEKGGIVAVITNLANPTRTVFMSVTNMLTSAGEAGLLGMAFHPGFQTNRYFYLFYTTTNSSGIIYDRLSRFEADPANPHAGLISSEFPLLSQLDEAPYHNGGDLHFGPDGYLYVSLGDEGTSTAYNIQRIDHDFFSGILRLDVDRNPSNLFPNAHTSIHYTASVPHYYVPADNPFIYTNSFNGLPLTNSQVRTEFWAVGLRNPWRFCIDEETGVIYCGDVGESTREEIDVILKGGNYGWNYREGFIARPGSGSAPAGMVAIEPIVDYNHGTATNAGNSVAGGFVYRGTRFPELQGAYIFCDSVSGHIWYLRSDGSTNFAPFTWLATDVGLASFGADPRNGDILMGDVYANQIRRLVYSTNNSMTNFPARLSDTGAFSSLTNLTPHPGIVPYDINVPFWSDHAIKTRWFSIPNTNLAMAFAPEQNWTFPTGTVWIKHFDLELTSGVPASTKRLETRFLVTSTTGVYGVTYRWDSLTNATLVPVGGTDEVFVVNEGATMRTQTWHYPSRSECLVCHVSVAGQALGFNTPQLNRHQTFAGSNENALLAFGRVGYFTNPPSSVTSLRALVPATNVDYSLEYRVRSYVAANCVQCHQPGGGGLGSWDARIQNPGSAAGIINGLLANDEGDPTNRVIKPGDLAHSMMHSRISRSTNGRMPPLASSVLNTQAIALVSNWVTTELASYQTFAEWQITHFGATNSPSADAHADPDGDGASNYQEYWTAGIPTNNADPWEISIDRTGGTARISFTHIANRRVEVQTSVALTNSTPWTALDDPANAPSYPATNRDVNIDDTNPASNRFYRLRLVEP